MENNKSLIVNNVSVRYRKQDSRSTADIVKHILRRSTSKNEFWALRNVSFTLEKGDMLGVIGRNGAGKSSMMKAISGTLLPASGTIEKNGTLCALLELGTGFDRDMTVRENIYLRGALLGYTKEFIDSKYDEIIDFADMREFEDSSFRNLSSGMKSRVAFSIASMVKPDIIILDEVFAVGDGDFRKKSQETMQSIISSGDTTALMVSHSLDSVRKQCNKVLWLHKGKMVMFGEPEPVCDAYAEFLKTKKLPKTDSLKAGEKNPVNNLKRSPRQKLGVIGAYLLLLLLTLSGIFFWSQHDILRAYSVSRSSSQAEILADIDGYRDEINGMLGISGTVWSDELVDSCAQAVIDDELTVREAAKKLLSESGLPSSSGDKLNIAAAELETVMQVYANRLETKLSGYRAEYDKLPQDDRPSLLLYVYSNYKSLFALEKQCDGEVQEIVDGLREQFKSDGVPEENADKIMNAYYAKKSLAISYYITTLTSEG